MNGNNSDRDRSPKNAPYNNANSNVVKHVRSGSNNHLNHRNSNASSNIIPFGVAP